MLTLINKVNKINSLLPCKRGFKKSEKCSQGHQELLNRNQQLIKEVLHYILNSTCLQIKINHTPFFNIKINKHLDHPLHGRELMETKDSFRHLISKIYFITSSLEIIACILWSCQITN